jgi:hypothetical protein
MGLDVYLLAEATELASRERERQWNDLYKRRDDGEITEEEFETLRKGLPAFERYPEVSSKKYPDHLFNRRYLRSSYNGAGFNRAVPELLGDEDANLYYVFEPVFKEEDQYLIELDHGSLAGLRSSKRRALNIAKRLRAEKRVLRAETISADPLYGDPYTNTKDDALAWYRKQADKPTGMGWWSNKDGHFYGAPEDPESGMRVLAAVPGVDVFSKAAVHLIYEMPRETMEHYASASEVTAEFCDEALTLIKRDGTAYIHWSA